MNGQDQRKKEMGETIRLREVRDSDLPTFFAQQLEPEAIHMAAFTAKEPADHAAFLAHWQRIRAAPTILIRTIEVGGEVAGYVLSYEEGSLPEVSYWLGKSYWGRGIATQALATFLAEHQPARPIFARAATDNLGSLRVLEKCGFRIVGEERGYANARGQEIAEYRLRLA